MISFIVPSIGRACLRRTLDSIECWPGDEILVVGNMGDIDDARVRFLPCAPGKDWGHTERNHAKLEASGQYIANIDDDDVYLPGTRALMADAIEKTPNQPVLFRMQYPNMVILWDQPILTMGNVGTPMMLLPNVRERFGHWGAFHGGDFHFLKTSPWAPADYVWRPEVIALLGHNQNEPLVMR